MFTGIVSALGRVAAARPGHLGICDEGTARRLHVGGSIAVNGCCLTVTEIEGDTFFTDVVPETLRRTNLGTLQPGDLVNLELPLRLDEGLDGHLVLAMDGVSLTVVAVSANPATFTIALIPYTLEQTIAQHYAPGTLVNLEADVVARYVHRLVNETRVG